MSKKLIFEKRKTDVYILVHTPSKELRTTSKLSNMSIANERSMIDSSSSEKEK
jgi:hypothetical protein